MSNDGPNSAGLNSAGLNNVAWAIVVLAGCVLAAAGTLATRADGALFCGGAVSVVGLWRLLRPAAPPPAK